MATAELAMPAEILVEPEDALYEVIDGAIVEKSMGNIECWVAFRLGYLLEAHVEARGLGRTFVETLFRTRASRRRRPDVAFLSADRWPLDRKFPEEEAFEIAPDLAVEVVSPNDLAVQLNLKVAEYFRAGVRQVWTVYRGTATIVVHESPALARTYGRGEVLPGGDLLPGFALTVSGLLAEPDAQREHDDGPTVEPA